MYPTLQYISALLLLFDVKASKHEKDGNNATGILRGPPIKVPNIAIGQLIHKGLGRAPADYIIMIESESGRQMKAKDVLLSSSKLAFGLTEKYRIVPGSTVFVIGENTIDVNLATLAVFYMGARMVPISPELKSRDFERIFNALTPKLVIADKKVIREVIDALNNSQSTADTILIQQMKGYESVADIISDVEDKKARNYRPAGNIDVKDVATVVFTSGTSGNPSAVAISHYALAYQAAVSLGIAQIQTVNINLQSSFLHWISGLTTTVSASIGGVRRILAQPTDFLGILTAIDKYKPDSMISVPSGMNYVLFHPRVDEFNLSSISVLTVAGSALSKKLLQRVKAKMPNCNVRQAYGLTENTGVLSITHPPLDVFSVGRVVPGAQVKIVDRASNPVGPDTDGEILFKSPSLFNGYIRHHNVIEKAVDMDGWFHTGDIGRYTSHGVLYITGSGREAIEIGHKTVFPQRIEEVIAEEKGVQDVAVAGVGPDRQILMALVVKKSATSVKKKEIIHRVRRRLPEYEHLRGGVEFMEKIPRTSTGKLDRHAIQQTAEKIYKETN